MFASSLIVAGATPCVPFEMISAVRGCVIVGGGGGGGGSSTLISILLDASSLSASVTTRETSYVPASSNVCSTVCSSLPSLPSPKSQVISEERRVGKECTCRW